MCELRNPGEFGIERQFCINGNLLMGRRFETRARAIAWAEHQQHIQTGQGWSVDPTAEWPLQPGPSRNRLISFRLARLQRSKPRAV